MAAPLLIECLFAPDCNSRENILPLVDRVVRKMVLRAEIKEIGVINQHAVCGREK